MRNAAKNFTVERPLSRSGQASAHPVVNCFASTSQFQPSKFALSPLALYNSP